MRSPCVAYDVFQAWVGTVSLELTHADVGPRLLVPSAIYAFNQVVTVLAIAQPVCVVTEGIVGNGGGIHLNVGAIWAV